MRKGAQTTETSAAKNTLCDRSVADLQTQHHAAGSPLPHICCQWTAHNPACCTKQRSMNEQTPHDTTPANTQHVQAHTSSKRPNGSLHSSAHHGSTAATGCNHAALHFTLHAPVTQLIMLDDRPCTCLCNSPLPSQQAAVTAQKEQPQETAAVPFCDAFVHSPMQRTRCQLIDM